MTKFTKKRLARYPLDEMIPRLEQWFESPLGKSILTEEQLLVDDKLRNLFGYHLLQMSMHRNLNLAGQSTIRHQFAMTPTIQSQGRCAAITDPSNLPLESDSIDVVVLHHVLEYSQTPHQMLREAARVTVPHGHVLIVGFNPWSFMGMRALMSRPLPSTVWQNRHVGIGRLFDWLSLLDLSVVSIDYCFYKLPLKQGMFLDKMQLLEQIGKKYHLPFGGCYVMVAKKETATLTPVRPRWFNKSSLVSGLKPSMYSHKTPKKSRLH
jgi:SAM-dependent methyltransferase